MSSSETDTRKGGRPRLSRQEVKQRREEIYRLHLAGLRESEIADHLHLSQSSVSEAIKSVRMGTSWFDKTARQRFADVIDQTRDMALATISESWKMYLSPGLMDKPAVRALFMGRIQSGVKILAEFVPDADQLRIEARVDEFKQTQDNLVEAQAEKIKTLEHMLDESRFKNRVLPAAPSVQGS